MGQGAGAQLIETSQVPRPMQGRCDAMQMNHKLRISEICETCNRKRKLCEILKWQNNGESEREEGSGVGGGGKEGETKGSQPKWQLKLHLSVESSVKTGSHLAKLERDQPKVLEQRQTEIEIERKREEAR